MSTNKQRRESERQRLQRQLEERRQREVARRRFTTIASIVGALVLVAAIVVIVVVASNSGDDKKKDTASKPSSTPAATTPTPTPTASATTAPAPLPAAACAAPQSGTTATFAGLTITGATNLKASPKVSGKANAADPATLTCKDLVVGTGTAASTKATATVEYIGLIYKTGKVFQSSWDSQPATFPLAAGPGGVIAGFSQGIAGAGKVVPMKAGGRRVLVMPAEIAYGANPPSGIPANASLVFVVDLQKIAG